MAGVITTGNHPKALWPGAREFFGTTYDEKPKQFAQIFEIKNSTMNYEEDTAITGFGLAPVKTEGGGVSYDSDSSEWTKRYTHVAYALGFIVTREEMDDNQYKTKAFRRAAGLAFSMRQTQEIVHANILNRQTTSGYNGGDGVVLSSVSHPSVNGNYANKAATDADFSEAALEDMLILVRNAKNSRGLRIAINGQKLIIPPDLMFEATRVMKSTLRSGVAENDINAVREMGLLPGGIVVNDYLTDTDAWFVQTNCPNGLLSFNRVGVELTNDNDFDTMNAKAKAYMRFTAGWTDPRGIYCSAGA